MRSNPLDGPGMGYGPAAGFDRRGSPVVTVVLALVCLVLAATLAFVLLRPTGGLTAAPVVTVTATPAASAPSAAPAPSTAARSVASVPLGVTEGDGVADRAAVAAFMRAWLEREPDVRIPLLQVSATESLTEKLSDVDPRKIPKAKPAGKPVISAASDYSAVADQKLSDKSTVRMELVYDPASRYGWLVDSVGPLE
jgi:hypothetical protein